MNLKLMEAMSQYKQLSFKIMNYIEEGKLDELNSLFNIRQKILDSIENIDYTLEEGKEVFLKLDLKELDSNMVELINKKKDELGTDIKAFFKSKNASNAYNKNGIHSSIFFNKKI